MASVPGGNDGLRGIDPTETEKNLQGIIEKVREKNANVQIVIAGMQMPENMGKEYTARYREVFLRVAKQNNATLIPFLLQDVAGYEKLNLGDGIHPNQEGHRIVANNVYQALSPLL